MLEQWKRNVQSQEEYGEGNFSDLHHFRTTWSFYLNSTRIEGESQLRQTPLHLLGSYVHRIIGHYRILTAPFGFQLIKFHKYLTRQDTKCSTAGIEMRKY